MANSDNKFFLAVIIGAVLIIGGIVLYSARNKSSVATGADVPNINVTDGHKKGPEDAKVKIVEFGDFECPYCGQAEAPLRQALQKNTDVELIFRNFPLPQHLNAQAAAQAAEAANKQGKYWEMHDLLYDHQDAWSNANDPQAVFTGYARQLNLDITKYQSDYKNNDTIQIIKDDQNYGESIKVDQTPTFFVNGKRVTGPQTLEQWQTLIDNAKK